MIVQKNAGFLARSNRVGGRMKNFEDIHVDVLSICTIYI